MLLPVICIFLLESVLKALAEQSVAVTNAIAVKRNTDGSTRLEIASGKASKTTVTESSILDILKRSNIYPAFCKNCLYLVKLAKVVKVCKNCATYQKLGREIANSLFGCFFAFLPRVGNFCHCRAANGAVKLGSGCVLHINTVICREKCFNCFDPFIHDFRDFLCDVLSVCFFHHAGKLCCQRVF